MFGWEFPPHITGGLGTACYGITKGLLSLEKELDISFVIPKSKCNDKKKFFRLMGADQVDLIKSQIRMEKFNLPLKYYSVESAMLPYVDPEDYKKLRDYKVENLEQAAPENPMPKIEFTGQYGPDLLREIHNFSVIGEHLASQELFDVIHAHDWLTYPAGVAAKKATGKPLVIHVHATEFDRSRGNVNQTVYQLELEGMQQADKIITVSNHTRNIVIQNYGVPASKVITVHNGVEAVEDLFSKPQQKKEGEKMVTFLGRITMQKGPEYFVELAVKVLRETNNVRFVMAGSGDMMKAMVCQVEEAGISDHFHFPGFLKGQDVFDLLRLSDVYVMPSVSEPFGISPLEAMQCGTPCIISNQSGVSEVIKHAIKTDYWDIDAMADAIHSLLYRPVLHKMLVQNGKREVANISWDECAQKIYSVYAQVA